MRKWVRTSAKTALLTAGFVALGAGVSFADSAPVTSGNGSIGGGNQIVGNADVPVNVSGNAVALGGSTANATSKDTSARVIDPSGTDGPVTSGNGSVLGGNQGVLDADAPVNVSGNAVAGVLSSAAATSEDTGAYVLESGRTGHSSPITSGNGSIIGGNQIVGHGDVPVNVSGNAVAAGLSTANAASEDTGAFVEHHRTGIDGPVTSGNGSAGGGNQIVGDLDVPVNASGNAVGAIGGAAAAASEDTKAIVTENGGPVDGGPGDGDNGDGDGGDNGDGYRTSQLAPATGGLIDTLSQASEPLHYQGHGVDAGPVMRQSHADVHDIVTSGNGSVVGGNQIVGDADVPVNASGNAVAGVLSTAAATSEDTGAFVEDGRDREVITSGNGSVLGGNQGVLDADVPINFSGNAIAGAGSMAAAASEDTGAFVDHSSDDVMRTSDASPAAAEQAPAGQAPAEGAGSGLPAPLDTLPLSNELPEAPAAAPELPGTETLPLSNEVPDPVNLPATESLPLSAEELPEAPQAPEAEVPEAPEELSGLPAGGAVQEPVSSLTEGLGLGL